MREEEEDLVKNLTAINLQPVLDLRCEHMEKIATRLASACGGRPKQYEQEATSRMRLIYDSAKRIDQAHVDATEQTLTLMTNSLHFKSPREAEVRHLTPFPDPLLSFEEMEKRRQMYVGEYEQYEQSDRFSFPKFCYQRITVDVKMCDQARQDFGRSAADRVYYGRLGDTMQATRFAALHSEERVRRERFIAAVGTACASSCALGETLNFHKHLTALVDRLLEAARDEWNTFDRVSSSWGQRLRNFVKDGLEQELQSIFESNLKVFSVSQVLGLQSTFNSWDHVQHQFSQMARATEQREGTPIFDAAGNINIEMLTRHLTRRLTMDPDFVYQCEITTLDDQTFLGNPLFKEMCLYFAEPQIRHLVERGRGWGARTIDAADSCLIA